MRVPVDVGADFKRWTVGLEVVTVASIKPQDGTTLATAEDVTALSAVPMQSAQSVADGTVAFTSNDFVLVAAEVTGFGLKTLDRITRTDGTVWIVGDVSTEGYGGLYRCKNCTLARE